MDFSLQQFVKIRLPLKNHEIFQMIKNDNLYNLYINNLNGLLENEYVFYSNML